MTSSVSSNFVKLIEFLKLVSRVQTEIDPTIDTSYDIFGYDYDPFEICGLLKYFHLEAEHVFANNESKFMRFFSNSKLTKNLQINNLDQILVNDVNLNNNLQIALTNQCQMDNVTNISHFSHLSECLAINVLTESKKDSLSLTGLQMNNELTFKEISTDFLENNFDSVWAGDFNFELKEDLERIWGASSPSNVTNDSGFSSGFSSPATRSRQPSLSLVDSSIRLSAPNRLHITNIPFVWRSPDMFKMFRKFGSVSKIQVIFSKELERKPLGYGFLTFASADQANTARIAIDQKFIDYVDDYGIQTTRQLTVNLAFLEKNQVTPEHERKRFEKHFSKNLREYLSKKDEKNVY